MKSVSKYSFKIIGLAFCVVLWGALSAQAQDNREKYVISAEAGGVNHVSGNVMVQREGLSGQQVLSSTDDLRSGDHVITGFGGRVEVLLNPGSYLRVGDNSEFEIADTSLDKLLVRLIKGSAVFEVVGADGVRFEIGVTTPQTDVVITRGGLYRFNILPNNMTELIVRKGRVSLGPGAEDEIRGGQKVLIGRGIRQFAKVNKKEQDALDFWSEDRAEMLASANRKLRRRDLVTAFSDFSWNDYNNSAGLWVYSARSRIACFLPDGSRVYVSPYGHPYAGGGGCGGCPPGTSNRPPTPQNNGNPPIATGGNGGGSGGSGGGGGNNDGGGNGGGGGGGNSNPTPSSAPASQPISQPAPQPSYQPPPPSAPVERSTPSRGMEQNPNR